MVPARRASAYRRSGNPRGGGGRLHHMDPGRPARAEDLSRLFEAHYADVVRIAFYLTGSWAVAEKLAQEAFLRLWRRWGGLRDHGKAAGYLRATVVNLSRSSLRRRLVELRHQRTLSEEAR